MKPPPGRSSTHPDTVVIALVSNVITNQRSRNAGERTLIRQFDFNKVVLIVLRGEQCRDCVCLAPVSGDAVVIIADTEVSNPGLAVGIKLKIEFLTGNRSPPLAMERGRWSTFRPDRSAYLLHSEYRDIRRSTRGNTTPLSIATDGLNSSLSLSEKVGPAFHVTPLSTELNNTMCLLTS